jgi:hypothetical protein
MSVITFEAQGVSWTIEEQRAVQKFIEEGFEQRLGASVEDFTFMTEFADWCAKKPLRLETWQLRAILTELGFKKFTQRKKKRWLGLQRKEKARGSTATRKVDSGTLVKAPDSRGASEVPGAGPEGHKPKRRARSR